MISHLKQSKRSQSFTHRTSKVEPKVRPDSELLMSIVKRKPANHDPFFPFAKKSYCLRLGADIILSYVDCCLHSDGDHVSQNSEDDQDSEFGANFLKQVRPRRVDGEGRVIDLDSPDSLPRYEPNDDVFL